ncbi:uncharacterized protein B0I36DRAFT_436685 [Microdochium trichocladiopsis]|uniref:Tyr recombinase domain-containing protein n=1 Tax=Microdochium trichocladiopsis TaxID=1682393 RepID=A0A9P9BI32_9PEZI|nr:uncharacterized protein B0I36DRAFT_436685 [Microdochium trichocladiopsis]KAH7012700.1 hypothetical protein B0I36DRAFT_436685 [Microdochium trichocladiopsis]
MCHSSAWSPNLSFLSLTLAGVLRTINSAMTRLRSKTHAVAASSTAKSTAKPRGVYARKLQRNHDQQRKDDEQRVNDFALKPLVETEKPLARKTRTQRESYWDALTMYLEIYHPNRTVDEIFVKLCEGGDVLHLIQGFFVSYITNSQVERPSLGPEEYVTVRQVKCAMTAMDIWKSLCMRADSTVLLNKRAENAQNAQMYILHTKKNVVGRQHGEVRKITEWIERKLAVDFDLRYDQTFEKKEMTLEDIMCFLQVLWEHAQHIRCSPQTRLSVHLMILLAGITGFRPCEVLGLKYSQVKLEVVRSPRRPQERSLVAHITIRRAKRELGKVERSQKNIFSFSIALNSSGILCPLRMMVAQALHNDAFEVPYKSLQEILCRPNLGNENTLQIRWKPSILDKSIIPITYPSYWETFGRGVLVMGVRDTDIRLYALRVGAGQNLDGTLTAALRNYVMRHTGNVFQKSYQPQHFAHDLVSLAFKDHAGDNSELFSMLRNATLRKDLGAPIYPKKEDLQKWKQRKDLTDLKSQYNDLVSQSSTQRPEAKAIMAKMQHITEVLSELRVAQLRKEYFSKIDRLRELGEPLPAPVDHINPFRTYNEKACLAARELGLALSQTTQLNQMEMSAVTDALVAYLGHQPFRIRAILQDAGMAQSLPDPPVMEVCSKPSSHGSMQQTLHVSHRWPTVSRSRETQQSQQSHPLSERDIRQTLSVPCVHQ